jgi:hypothetical protein
MALTLDYKVNLMKIRGTGDFACPKCGLQISPDDETDDSYLIVEQKTRQDLLEEVIIQCSRCKSLIRLTGFLLLEKE